MNLIVNSHRTLPATPTPPTLSAIALRVRDAGHAWAHCARPRRLGNADARLGHGAQHPRHPRRRRQPDLLRRPLPGLLDLRRRFRLRSPAPTAPAGARRPALVRRGAERSTATAPRDWVDFYQHLFGFSVLPRGQYFGVLPKGTLLESPCHKFYLQLIEPPPGAEDIHWEERLVRIGLGAPDVPAATQALQERGIVFVDRGAGAAERERRADAGLLGGVTFELVVSHLHVEPSHEPRPLRHGHHHAGRAAGGQAARRSAPPASRR